MKSYKGDNRREISFPVGGIGSGCIGLDGTGRLVDWEIFNRPNKGSLNGFSHFGIKAEKDGETIDARVMNSDYLGAFTGKHTETPGHHGYGYGPDRYLLCGAPHFRDSEFLGEFPKACIRFLDECFPGEVSMEAFNPFIPSNDADSSIPAAFYTLCVQNNTSDTLTYTFELSVNNPSPHTHIHREVSGESFRGIELGDDMTDKGNPGYGRLIFGVPAECDAQLQHYWYIGNWFDNIGVFWQDFTANGRLRDRMYDVLPKKESGDSEDVATIAVAKTLAPGESWRQRFLIGWYYPNCFKYWYMTLSNHDDLPQADDTIWHNYYAKLFTDASDVAEYAMQEWDRLEEETDLFREALYGSTLPDEEMEAVGANLAVLKSPTVLRLTDGELYGWEGCSCHEGSCEGSCSHVWNYAHAVPFLFPKLERSMRELDFRYNQREDGGMPFRLQLPLGSGRSRFRPCVDGQMGGIIKTYREWKICGDDEWLREWWPKVKKSLEFAWAPTNGDLWDPGKTGVITGRQHHTLDMELFGANAWLTGFYVGALKAASEMAEAMGDRDAETFRDLYERGRRYMDTELFNGSYYAQKVDIRDRNVLMPYADGTTLTGGSTIDTYWSTEEGQLKYQIGEGCIIDQVLGQWMCELAGVGEILDPEHVKTALASIYRNNFKPSLRFHFNPCRIFGLNDDSGLTICSWPDGAEKPVVPVPYAEEVMHGFEYQAASHMIRHGLEEEGTRVVRGIRDRYDGRKRNPWNEMECGSNYARSMASYALLLSRSGFSLDMRKGRIGFLPRHAGQYFWSVDGAWGVFRNTEGCAELSVLYGAIELRMIDVPDREKVQALYLNGSRIAFTPSADGLALAESVRIERGTVLRAVN